MTDPLDELEERRRAFREITKRCWACHKPKPRASIGGYYWCGGLKCRARITWAKICWLRESLKVHRP